MKYFRFALIVAVSAFTMARAQESDEQQRRPPTEIPDFSNLDEYIYEPKSAVRLGFRYLSGVNTKFSGQGSIPTPEDFTANQSGTNQSWNYHDGQVLPDGRTTARLDNSGNPMIDPESGQTITEPIAPDGKTNNWNYIDARQTDADHAFSGYVAFHSYSADVIDTAVRSAKSRTTNGLDLMVSRDMGTLLGGRVKWNLIGGMSVNDISARKIDFVRASVTTIANQHSLYGQNPPEPPYDASTSTTTQTVTNADGSTSSVTVDSSVLLGLDPAHSQTTTETNLTSVQNNWKVKGAYYTFRGGAEVWIPITSRFRISLTLAGVVLYSGTNYSVIQSFTPEIGSEITETDNTSAYKLLPGYYADASLQFDLTEKAGLFAGAIFQSAGSYKQTIDSETAHYTTKVDFKNQNGIRAGMSIRF